jgi:hypothetical protein
VDTRIAGSGFRGSQVSKKNRAILGSGNVEAVKTGNGWGTGIV